MLLAIGAALLSPLASSSPDGLERVAEDQGFASRARELPFQVMTDYLFPGVENTALATLLAGIVGTLLLFGVTYGLALLLRRQRSR